jgi:cytochrome P450
MAQPVFAAARLQRVAPSFVDAAGDAVERLAASRALVDLPAEMARLTLDAVGRTLLGASTVESAAAVAPALGVVQEYAIRTLYSPTPVWARGAARRLPTARARRYLAAVRTLDDVVGALVQERVRTAGEGDDLLGVLLASGQGAPPDPRAVRDEVMTFLLAGHETTAAALTWTLALLSRHPEVRQRLHEELDEVLDGRPVTQEDLARLPQLGAVLKESLRLYPPAWMLERQAQAADVVSGFDIPGGSTVVLSPYLTHRHPDFWANPEGFEPDRWLQGTTPGRGAYLPFGAGARQCIGGAFATLEASLMLATLLQRLTVDLAPGQTLAPVPRITLTAADGLRVRVTPRGAGPQGRVPGARREAEHGDAPARPAAAQR